VFSFQLLLVPQPFCSTTREHSDSSGAWISCLLPSPTTASTLSGFRSFRCFPLSRGRPWSARDFHTPSGIAPIPPDQLLLFLFLFYCISGLIFCIFLPMFTHVMVFGSLLLNTLHITHLLVTPILWHLCLKSLGPYLQKHRPRVLSFLGFFLDCLAFIVFFLSCCNLFSHVSKKKKKNQFFLFYFCLVPLTS
jgi:hypothetical protein